MANICFNSLQIRGDENIYKILILNLFYKTEPLQCTCLPREGVGLKSVTMKERDLIELEYSMTDLPSIKELKTKYEDTKVQTENFFTDKKMMGYVDTESINDISFGVSPDSNGGDTYYINFCTKWSPAIDLIYKLAEEYLELEFDYIFDECGECIAGNYIFKNGLCVFRIDESSDILQKEGDPYRAILRDYIGEKMYTCMKCKTIYDEGEFFEDDFESCENCEETKFFIGVKDENKIIDLSKDDKSICY